MSPTMIRAGRTATALRSHALPHRPQIIVVGASAGGVEALQTLVSGLPRGLPAAVFVVLHTASIESHVADVLNRNGNMAALYASNALPVAHGRIYVARPNLHLTLQDQHMWLDSGPKVNRSRPAIDPLFQSAAKSYGSRVIGVLLTGYLDDGSAGLAAIKNHGGIAIVQDPRDAYAPEMPRTALRLIKVDHCLPITEIAPLLVKLVRGEEKGRK